MATTRVIRRPSIKTLKETAHKQLGEPGLRLMEELEAKCVRLIQIQAQMNDLKDEAGYSDEYGHKHPGLKDQVERLFIKYNLYDGVYVEDFAVTIQTGSAPDRIDKLELARLGVSDEIINKATIEGRGWVTIRCQKRQARKKASKA